MHSRPSRLALRLPLSGLALTLAGLLGLACAHDGSDAGNKTGLPVDTSDVTEDDDDGGETTWTGTITGGGPAPGDDDSPDSMLTLLQEGSWTLSPPAGPYTSVSGTLIVTETVDGDEAGMTCYAEFALTGTALDNKDGEPCAQCEASFEVLHYLSVDGQTLVDPKTLEETDVPGLDNCMAPDLPDHDDTWILGLSSDGTAILRRLGVSGWQEWFAADQIGATVDFEWTATVGLEDNEDEDEE